MLSPSLTTKLLQMRCEMAAMQLRVALLRLRLAVKAGFDPNQPRVPAGSSEGGQWTRVGGDADERTRLAQAERPAGTPIDLLEEERRGGHTIARHVGRSPESLLARVRTGVYRSLFFRVELKRDGSFPSLMAATKLVNATLARNRAIVQRVAGGLDEYATVTAVFASKTGMEAYRPRPNAQPYLRDTYGVGVVIVHDPEATNGYTVLTAFPLNN
jgi:Bacterial CdiA-CT RNAse A domain